MGGSEWVLSFMPISRLLMFELSKRIRREDTYNCMHNLEIYNMRKKETENKNGKAQWFMWKKWVFGGKKGQNQIHCVLNFLSVEFNVMYYYYTAWQDPTRPNSILFLFRHLFNALFFICSQGQVTNTSLTSLLLSFFYYLYYFFYYFQPFPPKPEKKNERNLS